MGEGTLNVLSLLAHLCSAKGKLFLIEELENDIHPKALKALLALIAEKSNSNQFIISTHSNIVTKFLGSAESSKLFSLVMELDDKKIPTSSCREIGREPMERFRVLEDLGYEVTDFYLSKGYLILEESTAELLIRDFFIPFFVPQLEDKLKTIAAGGTSNLEPRLADFLRLFVFVHTSVPAYREKAWVVADGEPSGLEVINRLKATFKEWPPDHFRNFTAHNFEQYYPQQFSQRVAEVLAMPKSQQKKDAKGKLAREVFNWAMRDPETAKREFNNSAREVLDFLTEIASKLN
jgi:predicted ATP-dependent endonuclease of OLD family